MAHVDISIDISWYIWVNFITTLFSRTLESWFREIIPSHGRKIHEGYPTTNIDHLDIDAPNWLASWKLVRYKPQSYWTLFARNLIHINHHFCGLNLHIFVPSGKLTCWPWKWPIYSGFTSLPTPIWQGRTVNLPKGIFCCAGYYRGPCFAQVPALESSVQVTVTGVTAPWGDHGRGSLGRWEYERIVGRSWGYNGNTMGIHSGKLT